MTWNSLFNNNMINIINNNYNKNNNDNHKEIN